MSTDALIMAAGSGTRMEGALPKQYRHLGGKSVLARAVDALASHPSIDQVRVVIGKDQEEMARAALGERDVGEWIIGGDSRSQSVRNGLAAVRADRVLIHDAARPFCPLPVIDRLLSALDEHGAATPALASVDTLARRHGDRVGGTIDRDAIVRVQTPQAFRADLLRKAYAAHEGEPTDEAQVARAFGVDVALVEGDPMLEKLTTAEDFARAERMMAARTTTRVGMGFDVHAFAGSGPVRLGGLDITHDKGLSGHSDADVLLHALTDAILGAVAMGDIGDHFPPSDPQWKGADSEQFLRHAATLAAEAGGIIEHLDATIICEAPRIGPHRDAMRGNIARMLELDEGQVSVKATTSERLGFTGRKEGIACQAVATLRMEMK
ncbi:bifunctional 2-C-methyl-D-erythritol 4-phosphate cytidylyltransferase/2-C-methyl-D-erythritol 2,4-cyclodiphosphate synthase [Sphingomicrobium lutaoense]|uniref:Bifunctional enzyme IspD/IspF n=1 Tax=Sphingomicrobium lutaoense TaxID=515949 RepID=A0A839YZM2_9SPHN|nr:bifunctional 2-C-methyl-D-erythritol 4-phosphate cytidylyltransferase/2-C-methyl-D-erythritol 2,4-cyclodiphosphate synthase [Sphingomicrobium lutaoense]MBB3763778.1 2-C-methyl-D-erythritol 4-phosphate cytidylyltransferase/2-C-methyl-D-erythritol 2,4-cyclodiphosphate synthase [Sphingomicrobium lutaoense]